jgi:hypothetical protein
MRMGIQDLSGFRSLEGEVLGRSWTWAMSQGHTRSMFDNILLLRANTISYSKLTHMVLYSYRTEGNSWQGPNQGPSSIQVEQLRVTFGALIGHFMDNGLFESAF